MPSVCCHTRSRETAAISGLQVHGAPVVLQKSSHQLTGDDRDSAVAVRWCVRTGGPPGRHSKFLPMKIRWWRCVGTAGRLLLVLCCCLGAVDGAVADDEAGGEQHTLSSARRLRLTGRYGEAEEMFRTLRAAYPIRATVGLARTLAETGRDDQAREMLRDAIEQHPNAALMAELADLEFRRGRHDEAERLARRALALDDENVQARWRIAELQRVRGQLKAANDGYRWLVEYYNAHDVDDVDTLRWIGLAAARYARWNRLSDQFRFLVNELFPEMLSADETYWPAHFEAGRLFLEKFNPAEAARSLQQALAINPRAASVYAALGQLAVQRYELAKARQAAEHALKINPHLVVAHQVLADIEMANFRVDAALKHLETARRINPREETTLGRIAAAWIARDGWPKANNTDAPLNRLLNEVNEYNPRAGQFYLTAGVRLEERRKFAAAERMLREAIERMPQIVGARAALGMMSMRLGREDEARRLLETAFEIDPFNVRVNNMLQVLDVLSGYETIETKHFLVRFDPRQRILARHVGAYLEEVYPQLCGWLGHEPKNKTLFEIFGRARNTGAHGWFSARMIGLPYVGTVAACAGRMVAMASPNDMEEKFNWARVLKHEFVHVINLEQTNDNVPHWFTEALAVWNEGYPRPEEWQRVLARRHAAGRLFNLETINLGFIRPQSSEDWTLAYCQAELYAEYMMQRFGSESVARMLDAFADNLPTPKAIERALGVDLATFEQGYRRYVDRLLARSEMGGLSQTIDFAALERRQRQEPNDADLSARLAAEYLNRKLYPEARRMAKKTLALRPQDPLASYVMARLMLLIGETTKARQILEAAYEAFAKHDGKQAEAGNVELAERSEVERFGAEKVLALLAALAYRAGNYDRAARLYEQAARHDPQNPKWPRLLARVYLKQQAGEALARALEKVARFDADDFLVRKKLTQLALKREDYRQTVHWAHESLHIDVLDADVHRMLGQAQLELGETAAAIAAFETAAELSPDDPSLRMLLADAYLQAGKRDQARQTLETLLAKHPDYPGADVLLESLTP